MNFKNTIITVIVTASLIFGGLFAYENILSGKTKDPNKIEVVMLNGQVETLDKSEISSETVTPKKYTYTGPEYSNKGSYFDLFHAFGVGASEVAGSQKPAIIGAEKIPGINMETMTLNEGGGVEKTTMSANEVSIWDKIMARVKDSILWVAIGGLLLLVIPMFFPNAAPVISNIFTKIKNFIIWLSTVIPGFGTALAAQKASEAAKANAQVDKHVAMLQQINDSLTQVKNSVPVETWNTISDELKKNCDLDTQAAIGIIK